MLSAALAGVALPLLLLQPLAWALLCLLLPRPVRPWLTALGVLLQVLAAGLLCLRVLDGGSFEVQLGGWALPLGIGLQVDGLAACFCALTALVAGACALHAHYYFKGEDKRYFWPLLWFLWTGLNSLWLSADVFNLYVCLELVSLSAAGMVGLGGDCRALAAALRYLVAALAGSLAYLLGVVLLYVHSGTLSLSALGAAAEPSAPFLAALALMIAGLALKTALFPLHGWLPPAHGEAPAPVSALLSALVIKASFYVLLRIWLQLEDALTNPWASQFLALLGAMAVAWGSWQALLQQRLKSVVAYSTVAQIGYFFLFFALLRQAGPAFEGQAEAGLFLLLASHALAKAALFLSAGNLVHALGRDDLHELAGISRFRPLSLYSFGLAGVSLMGLPPSGGFTGKWLLLQSALVSGQWFWGLVLVLGGLASACYVFRVFRASFHEGPEEDIFNVPPHGLEVAPMTLAVASLLLGLLAGAPLALLEAGAVVPLETPAGTAPEPGFGVEVDARSGVGDPATSEPRTGAGR